MLVSLTTHKGQGSREENKCVKRGQVEKTYYFASNIAIWHKHLLIWVTCQKGQGHRMSDKWWFRSVMHLSHEGFALTMRFSQERQNEYSRIRFYMHQGTGQSIYLELLLSLLCTPMYLPVLFPGSAVWSQLVCGERFLCDHFCYLWWCYCGLCMFYLGSQVSILWITYLAPAQWQEMNWPW